ncbi:Uncharacterised protein [Mycobacterium tuberculosis]|nr:Uncharacterised protein [Mycobacterium tuberculosis]
MNPGVRHSTSSVTSSGTSSGTAHMASVNVASKRLAALPSAIHQGQMASLSSSSAYTGPV